MRKRQCDCPSCKAANEAEFFDIVYNPDNGQWLASTKVDDENTQTLQERLTAYNMRDGVN